LKSEDFPVGGGNLAKKLQNVASCGRDFWGNYRICVFLTSKRDVQKSAFEHYHFSGIYNLPATDCEKAWEVSGTLY
jgi:hypothetical protein